MPAESRGVGVGRHLDEEPEGRRRFGEQRDPRGRTARRPGETQNEVVVAAQVRTLVRVHQEDGTYRLLPEPRPDSGATDPGADGQEGR